MSTPHPSRIHRKEAPKVALMSRDLEFHLESWAVSGHLSVCQTSQSRKTEKETIGAQDLHRRYIKRKFSSIPGSSIELAMASLLDLVQSEGFSVGFLAVLLVRQFMK